VTPIRVIATAVPANPRSRPRGRSLLAAGHLYRPTARMEQNCLRRTCVSQNWGQWTRLGVTLRRLGDSNRAFAAHNQAGGSAANAVGRGSERVKVVRYRVIEDYLRVVGWCF
jgi:hypothetical protein